MFALILRYCKKLKNVTSSEVSDFFIASNQQNIMLATDKN